MCGSATDAHKILGKRLNQSQGRHPKNKIGITTTIVKCTDCGLIYSNPQPVPFDIQDHYGISPEEYWTEHHLKTDDTYFKPEINRLRQLLDFKPGMKSLDVGVGVGKAMVALSNEGFDAFGFEPSKQFYEHAISKTEINPDKLKLGMIENVDYPENEFDFISFGIVLEHLYNPSESIIKAIKWLKPEGIIHIETPSSDWLINKLANLYYKLNLTDYVGNLSPMHEPFHLHEFSLKSFQLHAEKNNYELAFYEYYVCRTFMPKLIDAVLKPYMKWTNKGMQLCVWLRKK
jgi:ubiquinone/menaquinone biosynthesis C-methylase UbiE